MIASRLGREDRGTGGGAPGLAFVGGVAAEGRFEGTGGGLGGLLLKPKSRADRGGGGTTRLFVRLGRVGEGLAVGLPGTAGGRSGDGSLTLVCRGGRDGLAGSSRVRFVSRPQNTIHDKLFWGLPGVLSWGGSAWLGT